MHETPRPIKFPRMEEPVINHDDIQSILKRTGLKPEPVLPPPRTAAARRGRPPKPKISSVPPITTVEERPVIETEVVPTDILPIVSHPRVVATKDDEKQKEGVAEILEKMKFSPIKELIRMYEEGKQTIVTKDGVEIVCELDASLKVKILCELYSYVESKRRPAEAQQVKSDRPLILVNYGNGLEIGRAHV